MTMHWKKLTNPNYLGAYSLESEGEYKNKTVTIESVAVEEIPNSDKKRKEDPDTIPAVVARLKGDKPFILNKTNLKAIEAAIGTPDVDKWKGARIELTVKKVKAFGSTTDALRVVPKKPPLPVLTTDHPKFEAAKNRIASGATMEQVRKHFQISKEVESILTKTSDEK